MRANDRVARVELEIDAYAPPQKLGSDAVVGCTAERHV